MKKLTLLTQSYGSLGEVINRETKQQDDFRETQLNPTKNLTSQQKDLFRGGGVDKDPPTSSAPDKQTPNQDQDRFDGDNNNSGNTGSTKSSQGTTTSQHQAFRN